MLVNREMKRNGSHAHNNYKFAHLSARLTAEVQLPRAHLYLSVSGKALQCCLYAFIAVILGRRKADLFSQRAASDMVCLSSKLQSMVYVPSRTHKNIHIHTYNRRVILANR